MADHHRSAAHCSGSCNGRKQSSLYDVWRADEVESNLHSTWEARMPLWKRREETAGNTKAKGNNDKMCE